jgi:hypothetical protein
MKGDTLLAIELILLLSAFGIISYWRIPIYEPAVKMVTDLLGDALILVLGYKFGRSMPMQAGDAVPGQSSQSTTTTETKSEPDKA